MKTSGSVRRVRELKYEIRVRQRNSESIESDEMSKYNSGETRYMYSYTTCHVHNQLTLPFTTPSPPSPDWGSRVQYVPIIPHRPLTGPRELPCLPRSSPTHPSSSQPTRPPPQHLATFRSTKHPDACRRRQYAAESEPRGR